MSHRVVGATPSCSMAPNHHHIPRYYELIDSCMPVILIRSQQPARPLTQHLLTMKPRSSRRLFASTADNVASTQLALPDNCQLVAGTFVVFKWENRCCMLQVNVTLYCWGRRRSGAIEHVLDKYGLSQSPQLYRINSKLVNSVQWRWLKQVFVVVHRLFC